ncbi:pyridoxamine 5'-phosphate oxidase family protein [Aquimarina brevivitae]|uniref:Pyridoxine/pyridoxamine 5'-phosphate oxidase n=1 Tax=Aquimarina brevivitae TaxID=323412 RepID=A0A4Q7PMQ6_9FLAO|nr:pyridoxamine 5'-phosphate oxidase family protein [Aquimarina brevivitae]RZT00313.1 pyridoxine/pyridoxamine 5'-phosphate oxidase [Aquimarina brevivitae]
MTDLIFNTIKKELSSALTDKKHPFRYFTMATSDISGRSRLRTVVLRDFDEDFNLYIYTDKRSKKITHIIEREWVSALFYDPEKLMQVVIRAKAYIIDDDKSLARAWQQIPEKSKRDYTTIQKPGEEIQNPEIVDYLDKKDFFTILKFVPDKVEYLKLKRPNHVRACFKRVGGGWDGSFIVP